MVYAWFFFCWGFSDVWWGFILDAEMIDLIVKFLLCPWLSPCLIELYHVPQVEKNST